LQPGLQQVGEEAVIAVPAALVVERVDEQVGGVEVFEEGLGVREDGRGMGTWI
jgi:hypothetical protein